MAVGAVYGPGIYLGADANTSFGYANPGMPYPRSILMRFDLDLVLYNFIMHQVARPQPRMSMEVTTAMARDCG